MVLLLNLLSLPLDEKSGASPLSAQAQKERITRLLVERISAQARLEPLLVVFEDVHWAVPTPLDALV
jgi:predicted ATPase